MEKSFFINGLWSANGHFHLTGDKVDLVAVQFTEFLQRMIDEFGVEVTSHNYGYHWNKETKK